MWNFAAGLGAIELMAGGIAIHRALSTPFSSAPWASVDNVVLLALTGVILVGFGGLTMTAGAILRSVQAR